MTQQDHEKTITGLHLCVAPAERRGRSLEYRPPRIISYGRLEELTRLQGDLDFDGLVGTADAT